MRREFHVRFCEGGGVRFPSATRLVKRRTQSARSACTGSQTRRASRREIRRDRPARGKQRRHHRERGRIGGGHAEEQRLHEPREQERAGDADSDADGDRQQSLFEQCPLHLPRGGAERHADVELGGLLSGHVEREDTTTASTSATLANRLTSIIDDRAGAAVRPMI